MFDDNILIPLNSGRIYPHFTFTYPPLIDLECCGKAFLQGEEYRLFKAANRV